MVCKIFSIDFIIQNKNRVISIRFKEIRREIYFTHDIKPADWKNKEENNLYTYIIIYNKYLKNERVTRDS